MDMGFRALAANHTLDFRTLSDFRKHHLEALSDLFRQVLALCQQAGLVKLTNVALDGTTVKANASKHHVKSSGWMQGKRAQLKAEVETILQQVQKMNAAEDRQTDPIRRGEERPPKLAFREGYWQKIEAAMEAQEQAEQAATKCRQNPGVPTDKPPTQIHRP